MTILCAFASPLPPTFGGVSGKQRRSVDLWRGMCRALSLIVLLSLICAGRAQALDGTIITVTGTGSSSNPNGDGDFATLATLNGATGMVTDAAGNLYIADTGNNRIRKVSLQTGIVTTVAGGGSVLGDGGFAVAAQLNEPAAVALDGAGNIYIVDSGNHRIRKVTVSTGIITTVAGTGTSGFLGDGAAATAARINGPKGLAVDGAGNLYIADADNRRIRKVTLSSGFISTIAGDGTTTFKGDGGQATLAGFNAPCAVALDASGNVFIVDQLHYRIRKITVSTGIITTVAGNGSNGFWGDGGAATSAEFSAARGIAVDSAGNFFIGDSANQRVRKVDVSTALITTVAGSNSTSGFAGDGGLATAARLGNPTGVWVDAAGNIFVADTANHRIRKVTDGPVVATKATAATNPVTGLTASLSALGGDNGGEPALTYTWATIGTAPAVATFSANGTNAAKSTTATFTKSGSYVFQVTIKDAANKTTTSNVVVTAAGTITTVAGGGGSGLGRNDGAQATSADINNGLTVAADSAGNLYIVDYHRVRKIDAVTGFLTTVAGIAGTSAGFSGDGGSALQAQLNTPTQVAVDVAGNIYIADTGNDRVRKVTAATGIITTIAGTGASGSYGNNVAATASRVLAPKGIAVDAAGNVYISSDASYIRKITAATGIITTIGGGGTGGDGGLATNALLDRPLQIAIDGSGNVYFPEVALGIRKISAASGIITTVAGKGSASVWTLNSPACTVSFGNPEAVAVDADGNLFISDRGREGVFRVDAITGTIAPVIGSSNTQIADNAPATTITPRPAYGVALDGARNLFVACSSTIRKVTDGPTVATPAAANATSLTSVPASTTLSVLGVDNAGEAALTYTWSVVSPAPATPTFNINGTNAAKATTVTFPKGGVYTLQVAIKDALNQRTSSSVVVKVSASITKLAGTTSGFSGDGGLAVLATMNSPNGVVVDGAGNLFIADTQNSRIRRIDAQTGVIATVAGTGTLGFSGDGGLATAAAIYRPKRVAVDAAGNLFISDSQNDRIRKVTAATGIITTIAGTGTTGFSGDGGAATSASLSSPDGIVVDAAGNVLFVDSGNKRVRKITVSTGIISTVAGSGGSTNTGDNGPATAAGLDTPNALAIDGGGNLFIALKGNPSEGGVRRVNAVTGIITVVAGISSGVVDGISAVNAGTSSVNGVCVDGPGNLFVSWQNRISRVDKVTGIISTVAGPSSGGVGGNSGDDGPAASALLSGPAGLCLDAAGSIIFADSGNNRIRKVTEGPFIVTQPSASPNPVTGTTTTLSVLGGDNGGEPALTYAWATVGTPPASVSFSANSTNAAKSSVATFTAPGLYTFRCTLTDGNGLTQTSNQLVVTVNAAPVITTQPASQSVNVGQTATFSVAVTGYPAPTFQWRKGGVAISGATAASYTTPASVAGDTGSIFTVVVTNSVGWVTSANAVLTVNQSPAITTQPANQSVTVGATATFTVTATGIPSPTYQWRKGGVTISGATAASYTTPATVAGDNGALFSVVVTNVAGTVTSANATLTVNTPPAITTQPAPQTVTVGATATFTVVATGTPAPAYQWRKGGVVISGATAASYTTPATVVGDNGALFSVVVTNVAGSVTSSNAMLTVNAPPVITTQPANQSVTAGATATFTVVATGAPTPTYQWRKGGVTISGATAASYTTPATVAGDNGALFSVVVTNANGTATSNNATLTVNVPPAITLQPASQSVTVGSTATFSVTATGTPAPTYQWRKGGVTISGATAASYTTPVTVAGDNGALFSVVVTNVAGSVTSANATLTVNVPPAITLQPANQSVTVGSTVTFSVTATGTPAPTYQWRKGGVTISGATAASYTTPATVAGDNGALFSVVVTNVAGSVTSANATLTVNVPPAITTQPAPQTVMEGATATFTVVATGTPAPAYQWRKGGTNIAGATALSYTTPVTVVGDTGALFSVVVTNVAGSVTSSNATLTVNALPSISITSPATGTSFTPPSGIPFTVTAADADGTVTKVEYFDGATLIGTVTASPFSFTWIGASVASHSITAKATDNLGGTKISSAIIVVMDTSPTVVLTSPANNATFVPPATISLAATATDSDGTITKVDFYQGATLLNSDTVSPYAFSWTSVPGGIYTITAKATDNLGVVTTSAPVTVKVMGPIPTVAMLPTASPTPVSGTTTTVMVLGDDDGGEASLIYTWSASPAGSVAFLPNGTHASQVSLVAFGAPGTYNLTCQIKDALNNSVTTTAIPVQVLDVAKTLAVTPSSAGVDLSTTQVFSATVVNQFGAPVTPQPTITWSVPNLAGQLSASTGASVTLDTNAAWTTVGGPYQMSVSGGGLSQSVYVTVIPPPSAGGGGTPPAGGWNPAQLHVGQKGKYHFDAGVFTANKGPYVRRVNIHHAEFKTDNGMPGRGRLGLIPFFIPAGSDETCLQRDFLNWPDVPQVDGKCEVVVFEAIGERPGKVTLSKKGFGNTNLLHAGNGYYYACDSECPEHELMVVNPDVPLNGTKDMVVTILPTDKPDRTPLGAKYCRVDAHGVPLPDPSPTGESEQDRIPNMAYTDMYSLAPTYSVTDVAQPVEGGELTMEFRRTMSIRARGYYSDAVKRTYVFPTEDLLGLGWDVNTGSHISLVYNQDGNGLYYQGATVVDEVGTTVSYIIDPVSGAFKPDVMHSFSNGALKSSLVATGPLTTAGTTLIFKKPHGTTLVFEQLPAISADPMVPGSKSVAADRTFMPPASTVGQCTVGTPRIEHYYRLKTITDRNGNQITFTYKLLDTTFDVSAPSTWPGKGPDSDMLVDTMYETLHPERKITFAYTNIGFEGRGLDTGWRISTVTDALNRQTQYAYYPIPALTNPLDPNSQAAGPNWANGRLLKSVTRPVVENPAGGTGQPVVNFNYYRKQLHDRSIDPVNPSSTLTLVPEVRFIAPLTITDARGHVTSFTYVPEWFPSALYVDLPTNNVVWDQKLRVETMTTMDGTARFATVLRSAPTPASASTVIAQVTDTRGTTNTYNFSSSLLSVAATTSQRAIGITQYTRTTTMASGPAQVATFQLSGDLCNNLTQVTDLSGNVIQFTYVNTASDAATDAFNKGILNVGQAVDPNLNPNRYQAYGKPFSRVIDPTGLNLATQYRYQTGLDANGQAIYTKQIKTIDAEGIVTVDTLDAKGNRLSVTEASGTAVARTTSYLYDSTGFITQITDADNRITTFAAAFTPGNPNAYRTVTATVKGYNGGPLLNFNSSDVFDVVGVKRSSTDALGRVTTMAYDNQNRLTSVTKPAVLNSQSVLVPSTSENHYDYNGNVVKTVDDEGNVTINAYDLMNRQASSRRRMTNPATDDNVNDLITYSVYDPVGLVASSIDANGNITSFTYDNLMRVVTKTYPAVIEPGTNQFIRYSESFEYGLKANGQSRNCGSGAFVYWSGWQPTRVIDRRGNAVDTTYDAIYRPTQVIHRLNPATASTAAAQPGEPTVVTAYNRVHKVVQTTTTNEDSVGGDATQRAYTFYDMLYRVTASVVDMDTTNGLVTLTGTTLSPSGATFVNFTVQDEDFSSFATDASALVTCTKYNSGDKPTFVRDAGGNVTWNYYDGANRLTVVNQAQVAIVDPANYNVSPNRPHTEINYDANGNKVLTEDANHTRTLMFYDDRNRLTKSIVDLNGDGIHSDAINGPDIVTTTLYNLVGKPARVTDSRGNATTTTYDRAYRVTAIQQPQVQDAENGNALVNPTIQTAYDHNGNVVQMTDARGVMKTNSYDQLNRVRTAVQAAGTADAVTTETQYDRNGNVTALLLFNGAASGGTQATTYVYDALNRKTSETLPSPDGAARVTTFAYYRNGSLFTATDPKAQVKKVLYDLAGRATTEYHYRSDGSTEETRGFTYNAVGKITNVTEFTNVTDLTGSTTYIYDALYRVTSEARTTTGQNAYTVLSDYDALGNHTRVVYPGSSRTLVRTIDRVGRLKTLTDGAKVSTYVYDVNGNALTCTDPNGVVTTQTFDALNRSLSSSTVKAATTIASYSYGFDRVGNRRTVAEDLPGQTPAQRTGTYLYDAQYRLTSEAWTGTGYTFSNAYTYDLAGNRTQVTGTNGTTTSTYDVLNRLVSSVNGATTTTHQYDLAGNQVGQVTGGSNTTLTWDTNNRLISVTSGGTTCTSSYDYRTRRQTKTLGATTTFFRYDRGVSFQEVQSGAVKVEFVRGNDMGGGIGSILYSDRTMVTGGVEETFAYNPSVGHVAALTNSSGVSIETNRFDAFGNVITTSGSSLNNRLANTKERDVIGTFTLDAHGFRYYNPVTGRYINRDPAGYPDGLNNYLYVRNNPINRIDPLGLAEADRVGDLPPIPDEHPIDLNPRSFSISPQTSFSQEPSSTNPSNQYYGPAAPGSMTYSPRTTYIPGVPWIATGKVYDEKSGGIRTGRVFEPVYPKKSGEEVLVGLITLGMQATPLGRLGGTRLASQGLQVVNKGGRTFTSSDPLVGNLANKIEAAYPGHVVGVNVRVENAAGQLVTDADILLQNAVIQVKSGGGKGLTSQVLRTQEATGLPTIGYGPTLKPSVVSGTNRAGGLATTDEKLLIDVVRP